MTDEQIAAVSEVSAPLLADEPASSTASKSPPPPSPRTKDDDELPTANFIIQQPPPDNNKQAAAGAPGPFSPTQRRIVSLRKMHFFVATLTYSLNVVTIWRLPYIYARHGSAFLVALAVCAVLITCPLLCSELFLGQLVWSQSYLAWPKLHPSLCGLGLSAFIFMLYVTIYSATPIAWALALAYHSLAHLLQLPYLLANPSSIGAMNATLEPPWILRTSEGLKASVAYDFFHNSVLTAVPRIEAMTSLRNYFVCEVLSAVILFWLIVFVLVLLRRHLHKITLLFTTLFLVVFLATLIASCVFAPNDQNQQNSFIVGMKRLLQWHDWTRLLMPRLWLDAAGQSLLAVGAMSGFVWINAAHLRLRNDFKRDAFVLTAHHLVTSLLALLFVYAGLGAYFKDPADDEKLFEELGPSLPFVAFLGLFSNWTDNRFFTYITPIVFFVLFALVQACCHVFNIVTAVNVLCHSRLPSLLRNSLFASGAICLFLLVFSHPFTTSTGIYLLQALDDYVLPFVTVALAVAEIFLFAWIYSWPRVRQATTRAVGAPPSIAWAVMWRFVAPCLACFILGAGVVSRILKPPQYLAYENAVAAKSDTGYFRFISYPMQMVWMDLVLIALALLPIFILPLLRKCGVVIFPYSPLRHEMELPLDERLSSARGSLLTGGFDPRYNFPYIDATIEEIIAWELQEREQIMYETLHHNGNGSQNGSNKGSKNYLRITPPDSRRSSNK